jgi:hypothetical protein
VLQIRPTGSWCSVLSSLVEWNAAAPFTMSMPLQNASSAQGAPSFGSGPLQTPSRHALPPGQSPST